MKRELDLAKGWLLKGDSDLANARRTVASDSPYDTACFHAQQAAEKIFESCYSGSWIGYSQNTRP